MHIAAGQDRICDIIGVQLIDISSSTIIPTEPRMTQFIDGGNINHCQFVGAWHLNIKPMPALTSDIYMLDSYYDHYYRLCMT